MKSPILGLAVSTLAFAGSSIFLWTQLEQERARADEVTQLSRHLNARIAELEKARGEFEQLRFAKEVAANPEIAATTSGNLPAPAHAAAERESKDENFAPPRPDISPVHQKMIRAQVRAHNRRVYADLGVELGLNREDTTRLIDLLSDQQLSGNLRMMESLTHPDEMQGQWEQQQRENQARIAELLGAEKAEALRAYQESLPARGEAEMIARQLEGSDAPLEDEQRKQLITALAEERARVPMPQYDNGADPENFAKLANEWQADYEQRVNTRARAILDTEQYNAYAEYQQWQREMREQIAVSRMNAGGNVTYAAPGAVSFAVAAPVPASVPAPEKK